MKTTRIIAAIISLSLCAITYALPPAKTSPPTNSNHRTLSEQLQENADFPPPTKEEADAMAALLKRCDQGEAKAVRELSDLWQRIWKNDDDRSRVRQVMALHLARRQLLGKEFPALHPKGLTESFGVLLYRAERRAEAVNVLLREAQSLDITATTCLNILYLYPVEGYPVQEPRILNLFRQLADEGSPHVQVMLAEILHDGVGVKKDAAKAMELLQKNDSEDAQKLLAHIYLSAGRQAEAEAIVKKAADAGESWGHYNYAVLLRDTGRYKEGFQHFLEADKLAPNDWPTVMNIGQCYIKGWGVKQDLKKGFECYRRAADDGEDAGAAFVTGMMYLEGNGVGQSEVEAKRYLRKAAKNGFDSAKEVLKSKGW